MIEQDGTHRTTQAFGTLQHMSPEQIDATPLDGRSDLYSLGLIYYELLAGVPPFRSESTRELLNLQCTAPPPLLPAAVRALLPDGLETFAMSLLEKRPEARPASAEVVCRILDNFAPEAASTRVSRAPLAPPPATSPRSISGRLPAGRAPLDAQHTVALVETLGQARQAPLGLLLLGLVVLVALGAAGVYGVLETNMPAAWSELSDEAPR
jgi:serine/threonine-protein kinase